MISQDAINEVKSIIENTESKSEAELVCVLSKNIDFGEISFYCAFYLSLIFSIIMLFCPHISKPMFFAYQIGFLGTFWLLFEYFPVFLRILLPKFFLRKKAYQFAHAKFRELGFNRVKFAVMFFVDFEDKFACIITSKELQKISGSQIWHEIVIELSTLCKNGKFEEAINNALKKTGEILVHNFPANSDNPNLIEKSVIEL